MFNKREFIAANVAMLLLPQIARAAQTPGVTDTEIKIGNTFAYSGPASSMATHARAMTAFFKMINETGGVGGRKINFLSYDNAGGPPRNIEEVRKLVEQDEVALLFNTFGSAANSAVLKYVNEKKVPQLFIYAGADKFNDPKNYPWTMGWQPSYRTEAQIYAKYLRSTKPKAKIGVLYQNDDFGKDYVLGLKDVFGAAADSTLVTVSHELTDASIDSQILQLRAAGCEVLISATGPRHAALAIRKNADISAPMFHIISNVSTSVSSVLTPAGLDKSVGIVSSTYLKDPTDPVWANDAGMREWRSFMSRYYPEGDAKDVNNLIGYCFAQTLMKVLQNCGGDFRRENIMKQATSLSNLVVAGLLPGITINTSSTNYRPIRQMQLSRFDGKNWERFGGVLTGVEG